MAAAPSGSSPSPDRSQPLYGQSLVDFITQGAKARKLDPNAVLAVVPHEGGFQGAVGDSGTSFGPFQLHVGGALPSSIKDNPATPSVDERAVWANSPAGVSYGLSRIRLVTPPTDMGTNQIHDQVYKFERPTNPAAEEAASIKTYFAMGGTEGNASDWLSGGTSVVTAPANAAVGAGKAVVSGLTSVTDLIKWLTDPHNLIRIGQVALGGVLLLLGLAMVGRSALASTGSLDQVQGAARLATKVAR